MNKLRESVEERQKLEKEYKEVLKDFAVRYIAIWNALKSLGMTDPQARGAISHILENSGGTMKDTMQEARQRCKNKEEADRIWKEFVGDVGGTND